VTAVYTVTGERFFASSNDLYTQLEYADDPERVVIDLSQSHIWDASTVASMDAIYDQVRTQGTTVEIVGLNNSCAERHGRLTGPSPPTDRRRRPAAGTRRSRQSSVEWVRIYSPHIRSDGHHGADSCVLCQHHAC
jgi:MFS superfamily sulfate permease-like transporter